MTDARILVIENSPSDPVGRLGDWLTAAGLVLREARPPSGEPLPESLDGYAALVVLGGGQSACGNRDGSEAAWFAAERHLLRHAVSERLPTLAICLGGQLLAQAYGGRVAPAAAGPEIGSRLVARRDAADADPLFAAVPFTPDVIQWHFDEIVELPAGAVLLATSPRYQHQAFRIGPRAWGTQFHIECDAPTLRSWAREDAEALADLGLEPDAVADACVAALDDVAEVWQPVAERFAGIVLGTLDVEAARDPLRQLRILGE
ncbi:MAG TPA: type 1 glutamine amidotransferase [Micromonosporaceae bacterium]